MTDGQPSTTTCDTHETTHASAIVCGHMIGSDRVLGFVENSTEPDDLQAWCNACEQMFLREQELSEAFREFCNFAVVCDACYARLKKQHSVEQT
jgi:hypothetical protein